MLTIAHSNVALSCYVCDTKLSFVFSLCVDKKLSSGFQFLSVSSYEIIVKFVFYQCFTMLLISLFLSVSYDVIVKFVHHGNSSEK